MNAEQKIIAAFRFLVLNEHYENFTVQTIVQHAGVGRSTFYAHFKSKDDLLLTSLKPILDALKAHVLQQPTTSVDNSMSTSATTSELGLALDGNLVFEHIWENRHLGRVFFQAPLVNRITHALRQTLPDPGDARTLFRLCGTLGLLGLWCEGHLDYSPAELAEHLRHEW